MQWKVPGVIRGPFFVRENPCHHTKSQRFLYICKKYMSQTFTEIFMRKAIFSILMTLTSLTWASAQNYLCFTANEAKSTIGIENKEGNQPDIEYSTDKSKWKKLDPAKGYTFKSAHEKIYLRGNNREGFSKENGRSRTQFVMTGSISASGSVMSLVDGTGDEQTIPSDNCFIRLFAKCSSLTHAPELPATRLTKGCYEEMFQGCEQLAQAPQLPATELAENCYKGMFQGCANLGQVPALPAKKLAKGCYESMFYGCSSITKAPALPATELEESCYALMFRNCANLSQAPELPAKELAPKCYSRMFDQCGKINYLKVHFTEWGDNGVDGRRTTVWLQDVAASGTFVSPGRLAAQFGSSAIPEGWEVIHEDGKKSAHDYLCFTTTKADAFIGLISYGESTPNVLYSTDGGENWKEVAFGDTLPLPFKGDKIYFKGINPKGFNHTKNGQDVRFFMQGSIAASGNVMSLVDGLGNASHTPGVGCFASLFKNCEALTKAPELPATSLGEACYQEMFYGCGGLTSAPQLPAQKMAADCYDGMFANCKNLTEAPALISTQLAKNCYNKMFSTCKALKQAPKLPATKLAEGCYQYMFCNCDNVNFQAPELPAKQAAPMCYQYMFAGCTNLKQAPVLPADSLAKGCYEGMFQNCEKLAKAPELPATRLEKECYYAMFNNCQALTSVPVLPATVMDKRCYGSMFEDCVNLTQAGALPSTRLAEACYEFMFKGCKKLTQAPALPADTLATGCYQSMFLGCTSLTKAPQLNSTHLANFCYKSMFKECAALTQVGDLPATSLATSCYESMFANCTKLVKAPTMSGTTLKENCYKEMFYHCGSLNYIKISSTTWGDKKGNRTFSEGWVDGVAKEGTFACPVRTIKEYSVNKIPKGWKVVAKN